MAFATTTLTNGLKISATETGGADIVLNANFSLLDAHLGDVANPHTVTAAQVGAIANPLTADLDAGGFFVAFDTATGIKDENGNEQLILTTVASAINHLGITNASIGTSPALAAIGDDTNIGLLLAAKGTGVVDLGGATLLVDATNKTIRLDSSVGVNTVPIVATALAIVGDASIHTSFLDLSGPIGGASGSIVGLNSACLLEPTGSLDAFVAAFNQSLLLSTSHDISAFVGTKSKLTVVGYSGTIAEGISLHADDTLLVGGTITNLFGLLVEDQTAGGTKNVGVETRQSVGHNFYAAGVAGSRLGMDAAFVGFGDDPDGDAGFMYNGTDFLCLPDWNAGTGSFVIEKTEDAVSTETLVLIGNTMAAPGDGDESHISLKLDDSAGDPFEYVRQTWVAVDVTAGGDEDGRYELDCAKAGTLTTMLSAGYTAAGVGEIVLNEPLYLKEVAAPAAKAGHGTLYTTNVNELFFTDGAGNTHLLHGDAFASMWYHNGTDVITITDPNELVLIDSFENSGPADDLGKATSDPVTTNLITIGTNGAGEFDLFFNLSSTVGGGSAKELLVVPGITLATPLDITGATNATPIVLTSTAHNKLNGDIIEVVGVLGNTAANGTWRVSAKTDDTITLLFLDGANSVGNGAYTAATGDITIHYPGNAVARAKISASDVESMGNAAISPLNGGDKVGLYVANIDDDNDPSIVSVSLNVQRIGDI